MTLNKKFSDSGEFMEWLANNCYSCAKLPDDSTEYNSECKLEPIISYAALDEKFDDKLAQLISENGRPCKCKNFVRESNLLNEIISLSHFEANKTTGLCTSLLQ